MITLTKTFTDKTSIQMSFETVGEKVKVTTPIGVSYLPEHVAQRFYNARLAEGFVAPAKPAPKAKAAPKAKPKAKAKPAPAQELDLDDNDVCPW